MQHLLGTSHIEFDGDVAWVETYLWTFARFTANGQSTDTFTGGRLVDRFERRQPGPGNRQGNQRRDGDALHYLQSGKSHVRLPRVSQVHPS